MIDMQGKFIHLSPRKDLSDPEGLETVLWYNRIGWKKLSIILGVDSERQKPGVTLYEVTSNKNNCTFEIVKCFY